MTDYEIKTNGAIFRRRDGAWIPEDPRNADYRDYLEWLARGNVPDAENVGSPP